MYHTIFLDERISLLPTELNQITSAESVQEMLLTKLKEKHEGKCNANGFVKPGSVAILARSMGVAENGRFTGNLLYDCKIKCEILYPTAGSVFTASILKVNKMGAYAHFEDAIRVLLPRDLHIGSTEFDNLHEGDVVKIRLERSRFQTNDPFIMAVGLLVPSGADAATASRRVATNAVVSNNTNLPPLSDTDATTSLNVRNNE